MKKGYIKIFDLILFFWIVVFLSVIFIESDSPRYLLIVFAVSGLSLLAYLIYVIRLRYILIRLLEKERKEAETIEANTFSTGDNSYHKIKQTFLEDEIQMELLKIFPKGKVLRNCYLPTAGGKKSEIDILLIDTSGLYIIEAKNYSGFISGNWSSDTLKIKYNSGNEFEIQNPIVQNSQHYDCLKAVLGINEKNSIKNIVVFGSQIKYDKAIYESTKKNFANVMQINQMHKELLKIKAYSKFNKDLIWVEQTYNNLKENTKVTSADKQQHIRNVENQYKQ